MVLLQENADSSSLLMLVNSERGNKYYDPRALPMRKDNIAISAFSKLWWG